MVTINSSCNRCNFITHKLSSWIYLTSTYVPHFTIFVRPATWVRWFGCCDLARSETIACVQLIRKGTGAEEVLLVTSGMRTHGRVWLSTTPVWVGHFDVAVSAVQSECLPQIANDILTRCKCEFIKNRFKIRLFINDTGKSTISYAGNKK